MHDILSYGLGFASAATVVGISLLTLRAYLRLRAKILPHRFSRRGSSLVRAAAAPESAWEVRDLADGSRLLYEHGTIHGGRARDGAPLTYYPRESAPMQLLAGYGPGSRVGVVGLGAGAMASAIGPGVEITFHELSAEMIAVAQECFDFLARSRGSVRIVEGDGLVTLAELPDGAYDALLIDGFVGKFVPPTLLDAGAFSIYRRVVGEEGLIAVHVSGVADSALAALPAPVAIANQRTAGRVLGARWLAYGGPAAASRLRAAGWSVGNDRQSRALIRRLSALARSAGSQ